jgi:hypothetical protein
MTTNEIIVLAIFGVGLVCSLVLLFGLRRLLRREREKGE